MTTPDPSLRLANASPGADDPAPEIFRSLQGEGRSAGAVRTFIRLSGCNLHCVWCDTAYTWNWIGSPHAHVRDAPGRPHQFDPRREIAALPVSQVAAQALALQAPGYVITGGEPLVQERGVLALIERIKTAQPGAWVEIETNGALAPDPALLAAVNQFNVSPKLAHSGNATATAINADALAAYAPHPGAFLKIVARTPRDLDDADAVVAAAGFSPERVDIMPEGTDSETLRRRARALAEPCLARGYGLSDRLHVHLFGARRGV